MMYQWTNEKLKWMEAATSYTQLYPQIATLIAPKLALSDTICDAGCGTGGLSLAIAPLVRQVVAVDVDSRAIEILINNIKTRDIKNITVINHDIFAEVLPLQFDTMVYCRFASIEEILATTQAYRCHKAIIIKQRNKTHRFDYQRTRTSKDSYDHMLEQLSLLKLPYEEQLATVESGQPFTSLQEARSFFEAYGQEGQAIPGELETAQRLIATQDKRFPFYLPAQSELSIITCNLA